MRFERLRGGGFIKRYPKVTLTISVRRKDRAYYVSELTEASDFLPKKIKGAVFYSSIEAKAFCDSYAENF